MITITIGKVNQFECILFFFSIIFLFISSLFLIDVLCGSLLGLFVAYFCYRQHYPALESIDADTPLVVLNPVLDTSTNANLLPFKMV